MAVESTGTMGEPVVLSSIQSFGGQSSGNLLLHTVFFCLFLYPLSIFNQVLFQLTLLSGFGTTKNGAHKRGRRTLNPGYEALLSVTSTTCIVFAVWVQVSTCEVSTCA